MLPRRGPFIFLALLLGACTSARSSGFLETNNGLCRDGAYPSTAWPEGKPTSIEVWGSWCAQGDRTVGSAASLPFRVSQDLTLYLSGSPGSSSVSLALENVADHAKLSIVPQDSPGTHWLEYTFEVPAPWVGKSVRLVATDNATGLGEWLGFSQPVPAPSRWDFADAANLLLRTASHFLLLFIPCFALCAFAVWKGVRNVVVLGLVALVGTAAPGYMMFWLWLFSPRIGHALSFCIPILAAAALIVLLRRIGGSGRQVLKPLLLPAMLVLLSSLWIVSAGFSYGGMRSPLVSARARFSHPLPPDNELPYLFAEGIRYGHVPSPLLGDWLSSDRPPLQTAIALSQYPYLPQPRALGHESLAVVLQSTWIFALWILLIAFEIDPRAIRLVLATTLFWGFTLVNSFYVWPKLLAASYMLGFVAVLLRSGSFSLSVLAGTLLAFGLLAHGGSAFALIGVFFTFLAWKKRLPVRALVLTMLTCLLIYAPWIWYQKFYDPPGNYLLKLQLAGVEHVDQQSLLQDLVTAYGNLSFRQWLNGREQNVTKLTDQGESYWQNLSTLFTSAGHRDLAYHVSRELRAESFFNFFPNLGLLAAGPVLLLAGIRKRYRTVEWRAAALLWTLVIWTLIAWCLIMFVPGSTSIHQGTYVAVLLASTGSVLAFWALSRWLAYTVCAVQILQSVLLYGVFMREPLADGALVEGTAHYATIALFFVTFTLCCLTIARPCTAPNREQIAKIHRVGPCLPDQL